MDVAIQDATLNTLQEWILSFQASPTLAQFYLNDALVATVSDPAALPPGEIFRVVLNSNSKESVAKSIEVDYVGYQGQR